MKQEKKLQFTIHLVANISMSLAGIVYEINFGSFEGNSDYLDFVRDHRRLKVSFEENTEALQADIGSGV